MHKTDLKYEPMNTLTREITPLTNDDVFLLLNNPQARFDYPLHFHSDFELNLVLGTQGKRLVGDSVEDFAEIDLILLGPNLPHAWKAPTLQRTHVITLQFSDSFSENELIGKRLFAPIKKMLERSTQGIDFSPETRQRIADKLIALTKSQGFNTFLDFCSILYDLAISPQQRLLASTSYNTDTVIRESKSRRIKLACEYIEQNYMNSISLSDVAKLTNMSDSAFSHFFKKRTSRSFINFLNEIRIGHANKLLSETSHNISEICYMCGFSNISNFNRIFKKSAGISPSEYRNQIHDILIRF